MKELSTEQKKAKAYNEAVKVIKDNLDALNEITETGAEIVNIQTIKNCFYRAFPELKESEDDRIKKAIIELVKQSSEILSKQNQKDMLAWLEKQGEQKPDVEPKFHEGDIIKHNKANIICKVISVNSGSYYVENIKTSSRIELFNAEQNFHIWTIEDAKEGDVVVDKTDGVIGIFQSIGNHPDGGSCNDPSYCFLHCRYDDGFFYADFENGNTIDSYDLTPATKEQHYLLFQEMKEAGYEWDADKKELKKDNVELTDFEKSLKHIMIETLECGDTRNLKADAEMLLRLAQKPADNVEAKFRFNVGQWIVATGKCAYLITKIDGFNVTLVDVNGNEYVFDTSSFDGAHLWTIQDAKEGDVLVDEDNNIGIYERIEGLCWHSYIYLGCDNCLYGFSIGGSHEKNNTKPATKEQRDTLMKAMKGAGYTFDFESKELKKIEDEPAWSEEDERRLNTICGLLEDIPSQQIWLKGLKDRIQSHQKINGDEKDKEKLESIINKASYNCGIKNDDISFLKSLKQRLGGEK